MVRLQKPYQHDLYRSVAARGWLSTGEINLFGTNGVGLLLHYLKERLPPLFIVTSSLLVL
jgi:hypothetical protein